MIEIQNLVKKYISGRIETTVINNISFSIRDGQFVAITGQSGAGKSTLLYLMGLLERPTNGTVAIDGSVISTMDERTAIRYRLNNFGFVFQDYALFPELTALENVMLPILMAGGNQTFAKKQAQDILQKLGLGKTMNQLPSRMSGGEQQRASIARAIVRKPKILFADEPTANLDNRRSNEVMSIFWDLYKQGQTIILVTHEPKFAEMAERIISLLDGQIITDDTFKK